MENNVIKKFNKVSKLYLKSTLNWFSSRTRDQVTKIVTFLTLLSLLTSGGIFIYSKRCSIFEERCENKLIKHLSVGLPISKANELYGSPILNEIIKLKHFSKIISGNMLGYRLNNYTLTLISSNNKNVDCFYIQSNYGKNIELPYYSDNNKNLSNVNFAGNYPKVHNIKLGSDTLREFDGLNYIHDFWDGGCIRLNRNYLFGGSFSDLSVVAGTTNCTIREEEYGVRNSDQLSTGDRNQYRNNLVSGLKLDVFGVLDQDCIDSRIYPFDSNGTFSLLSPEIKSK